ncbi:MAG: NUDIX hydrolase [Methanosarcinales archaeon]
MEKSNIAVSAIVIKNKKFLLLKRNNPPFKWGPPGGRVFKGESLLDAVLRETKEEANVNVKILMPIGIWSGYHDDKRLLSISFLCEYISGEVRVSTEHSKAKWLDVEEIKREIKNENITYSIKEFIRAKEIKNLFDNKKLY